MWYIVYTDGTVVEVYQNDIEARIATTDGVMAIFRLKSEAYHYLGIEDND